MARTAQADVLLLRRDGVAEGSSKPHANMKLEFYDTEEALLTALFHALLEYPLILTFNGDDFDLKYLYHRAQRLGFRNEEIPIEIGRDVAFLKYGVHVVSSSFSTGQFKSTLSPRNTAKTH